MWVAGTGEPGVKPVIIELTDFKTKEVVDHLEVDACLVATGRAPYTQASLPLTDLILSSTSHLQPPPPPSPPPACPLPPSPPCVAHKQTQNDGLVMPKAQRMSCSCYHDRHQALSGVPLLLRRSCLCQPCCLAWHFLCLCVASATCKAFAFASMQLSSPPDVPVLRLLLEMKALRLLHKTVRQSMS